MIDLLREAAPRRPVRWDIQVNTGVTKNSMEYNPSKGVVIRANSIDLALAYVSRARELVEKYPGNPPDRNRPMGYSEGEEPMAYYRICPDCGAHLDPGEHCDCRDNEKSPTSAANADGGKGGTDLASPDSTSSIHRNGGNVK